MHRCDCYTRTHARRMIRHGYSTTNEGESVCTFICARNIIYARITDSSCDTMIRCTSTSARLSNQPMDHALRLYGAHRLPQEATNRWTTLSQNYRSFLLLQGLDVRASRPYGRTVAVGGWRSLAPSNERERTRAHKTALAPPKYLYAEWRGEPKNLNKG